MIAALRTLLTLGLCWLVWPWSLVATTAPRLKLAWPTPNPAWVEGKDITAYIQPTESGEPTSGLWGCVRSGGLQFHEGIDLCPIHRDARGEPTDKVFAALDGVVRYINHVPGNSSYGRYIVLEHPGLTPAIYTLYAHLRSIEPGVKEGTVLQRGQAIAGMGHTSGGYKIPADRAHLHFEMGLRLTNDFQRWYDWKKFGSKNDHGYWNGMNLTGFDPLDFFNRFRSKEVNNFADYFSLMKPAVTVWVNNSKTPDFVERYPSLLKVPDEGVVLTAGWEIKFTASGLPFAWKRLSLSDLSGYRKGEMRIVQADENQLKDFRGRHLVRIRKGRNVMAEDLESNLQLLFGVR